MNWDALLAELRIDLEDPLPTPKFPDAMLYVYLREAVADYSQYLPLVRNNVTLVQDPEDVRKFALPADFLAETLVSCPAGQYLQPRRGRLGTRVVLGKRTFFYHRDNTHLYLDVDPAGEPVVIDYKANHPIPANAGDTTFVLTVPEYDFELIKLYIEAKVNAKIRNTQARLDRFKIGAGSRSDNPMKYEAEDFFAAYKDKLVQRIPSGSVTLFRPRKYR